ncbi:MAG: hypothetical protein JRF40_11760 [Deltaproteobacteria bacterium]|nr:hypothetical protein [Deltaproteobacteria bacterium]MBW2220150.1 hypothetical protein [Deltaproteobacteria bacterium]
MRNKFRKSKPRQDKEIVAFTTNAMIEAYARNRAMASLKAARLTIPGSAKAKLNLFRLTGAIETHPDTAAFFKIKDELIKAHEAEQNKLPACERKGLLMTDPGIVELLEQKTSLHVEKIDFPVSCLPEDISVIDMHSLSWLINFTK